MGEHPVDAGRARAVLTQQSGSTQDHPVTAVTPARAHPLHDLPSWPNGPPGAGYLQVTYGIWHRTCKRSGGPGTGTHRRTTPSSTTTRGGRRSGRRAPCTSAVFAGADIVAMVVLEAVGEAGWSVPGDLSVAGYEQHDLRRARPDLPDERRPGGPGDRPERRASAAAADRGPRQAVGAGQTVLHAGGTAHHGPARSIAAQDLTWAGPGGAPVCAFTSDGSRSRTTCTVRSVPTVRAERGVE